MPAIGSRAALARTRGLRLVGLVLALIFVATIGATWSTTAEAKNWQPQIGATRRAQVYWESVMRGADADLRRLQRSKRQTQRKLISVKASLRVAVQRRAMAKRKLKDARKKLVNARAARKAAATPAPPLPTVALALEVLIPTPPSVAEQPLAPDVASDSGDEADGARLAVAPAGQPTIDRKTVRQLERKVKLAKRDFKRDRRKARRSARNVRVVANRLRSIQAAMRSATARRERAERSLGAWILAMTRYGRIRATKKSDVRPGVNSSFAWPVHGRISQYYHARHDGVDIVRYKGAGVHSMAFGVVTYVGWNPWDEHGRAFMVVVTHAGGYETLYGHLLPKRIVRVGELVRKGQVIGYMGNTGNSTGTHLHLELRRGRTTINPLSVL